MQQESLRRFVVFGALNKRGSLENELLTDAGHVNSRILYNWFFPSSACIDLSSINVYVYTCMRPGDGCTTGYSLERGRGLEGAESGWHFHFMVHLASSILRCFALLPQKLFLNGNLTDNSFSVKFICSCFGEGFLESTDVLLLAVLPMYHLLTFDPDSHHHDFSYISTPAAYV